LSCVPRTRGQHSTKLETIVARPGIQARNLRIELINLIWTYRYRLIKWDAIDGNFKVYGKAKKFDASDLPLTDGVGFFPLWSDWMKYCEDHDENDSVRVKCASSLSRDS
jgi:hypothetical protein